MTCDMIDTSEKGNAMEHDKIEQGRNRNIIGDPRKAWKRTEKNGLRS